MLVAGDPQHSCFGGGPNVQAVTSEIHRFAYMCTLTKPGCFKLKIRPKKCYLSCDAKHFKTGNQVSAVWLRSWCCLRAIVLILLVCGVLFGLWVDTFPLNYVKAYAMFSS